jgi:hypothetical protein
VPLKELETFASSTNLKFPLTINSAVITKASRLRAVDVGVKCIPGGAKSDNAPNFSLISPTIGTVGAAASVFNINFPLAGKFTLCIDTPDVVNLGASVSVAVGPLVVRAIKPLTDSIKLKITDSNVPITLTGSYIRPDTRIVLVDADSSSCSIETFSAGEDAALLTVTLSQQVVSDDGSTLTTTATPSDKGR